MRAHTVWQSTMMRRTKAVVVSALLMIMPGLSQAHVSEQGFVLLMPTHIYLSAGVLAVVLTVVALALTPARFTGHLFSSWRVFTVTESHAIQTFTSLLSLAVFMGLLVLGIVGSRAPLQNPLPLFVWTVWWIGLVGLQGLLGNVWYWVNPWSGIYRLLTRARSRPDCDRNRLDRTASAVNAWPAIVAFLLLVSFALVDLAPDDPFRVAMIAAAYWLYTLIAMLLVGEQAWLMRGEFMTLMMRCYANLAPLGQIANELRMGLPGWQTLAFPIRSFSMAVFVLLLLGCGSFDGLNETFWWLSLIGINPLEFPGRSAVVLQSTIGLILTNLALIAAFGSCVWLGLKLTGQQTGSPGFRQVFTRLSVSMLPIAFAYHLAHYATAFMVNMQYVVAATSDPLARGDDWLELGQFYVTTGFLNDHHSVELIWLSQAAVVVAGHVLSVILAHAIATELFGNRRRAVLSQLPLATFMIFYTFLGLWLLASPKSA